MNRRHFLSTLTSAAVAAAVPLRARAQTPASPDTLAHRLADYAASLRYEDLDAATVETVKSHFIDALGCAIAAHDEGPVRIARQVALATGGGTATLLGTTQRTTPDLAAFANGAALRYFDLNDAYAGKETGHPSDNVAPCLAVAESGRSSGRDLILAIALAYEVNCRLMDAAAISPRGWDHTCYSLPAVALATGRLMGLTRPQLVQAVNLAINGHMAINQTRIQELSNWKALADADAARNAIFATRLAREGLTGPSPIFEGGAGFFKQISGAFDVDLTQFGGRGGRFRINDCIVKYYPAQGLTQTSIPAAIEVAAQVGDLGRIRSIEIATTQVGYVTAGKDRQKWAPETSETADHSLPYIVARAMLDGDITTASYTPAALRDPKLHALIERITVVEDPALTARYPQYAPNRVTAVTDDGRKFTREVDDLPGFPHHPMMRADFETKFTRCVRPYWKAAQTRRTLDWLWGLDAQPDVSTLPALMTIRA
ncbi:MmgE/PrpD family protein [Burkholderia sp. LMG 32019]|uniref:MmgE/PrpD family protein n=1 Tax=Burkholderia sp. LMG 32019 TaxID=3158173 RepID=UPI003C2CA9DA